MGKNTNGKFKGRRSCGHRSAPGRRPSGRTPITIYMLSHDHMGVLYLKQTIHECRIAWAVPVYMSTAIFGSSRRDSKYALRDRDSSMEKDLEARLRDPLSTGRLDTDKFTIESDILVQSPRYVLASNMSIKGDEWVSLIMASQGKEFRVDAK